MPKNIRLCAIGTKILEFFLVSSTALALCVIWFGLIRHTWAFGKNPAAWIAGGIAVFLAEFILFWIGIVLVYTTSLQLGFKKRIVGALCGWIPFVNLFMLVGIIRTCREEVKAERGLALRDKERAQKQVCKTKYPLLLVHGVFFRDFDHFNYWGRIPAELKKNGATIYYGEHNSAAAVADSALELEKRIREIVEQTGCGKVNIIAHSKGGLDSRAAISTTSAGKYVASLTTINTPHRGCEFADYLLAEIPEKQHSRPSRSSTIRSPQNLATKIRTFWQRFTTSLRKNAVSAMRSSSMIRTSSISLSDRSCRRPRPGSFPSTSRIILSSILTGKMMALSA